MNSHVKTIDNGTIWHVDLFNSSTAVSESISEVAL